MVEYRTFQNADPPALVALWHACELGRGSARGFTYDALDSLNFAQPYFDANDLIIACSDNQIIGMVHVGFGCDESKSRLSKDHGIICIVLVHPEHRRRGIGRELISRANARLSKAGAKHIQAGPAPAADPFYFGLYGGSQPSGFLQSDANADPFFHSLGYVRSESHGIFQRDVAEKSDPVNFRLSRIRRKTELEISPQPDNPTWWWMTRLGRLDSLCFRLIPKDGGQSFAELTVVGLDLYIDTWQERAIGILDLEVVETERRCGYGQALLVETIRRLRQEMVTRFEMHVPDDNVAAISLVESVGFVRVDTGIVYRKAGENEQPSPDESTVDIPEDKSATADSTIVFKKSV